VKFINNEVIKEDQHILSIRTKTTMTDLPTVIEESYSKIFDYLNELGEEPTDVPFTAYHSLDMDNLDVEMGFPVSKQLPGKDDIQAGIIPAGAQLTCTYKGPYSGMEDPYSEMFAWIKDNGYEATGVFYEYYYNSPGEVPESELLTKIVIPLKSC